MDGGFMSQPEHPLTAHTGNAAFPGYSIDPATILRREYAEETLLALADYLGVESIVIQWPGELGALDSDKYHKLYDPAGHCRQCGALVGLGGVDATDQRLNDLVQRLDATDQRQDTYGYAAIHTKWHQDHG